MSWKRDNPGCPCCTPTTLTVTARTCASGSQLFGFTARVYDEDDNLLFEESDGGAGGISAKPFPSVTGTGTLEIESDYPERIVTLTKPISYHPGANSASAVLDIVASDYACIGGGLSYPLSKTLHWSDSVYGSVTLNYGNSGDPDQFGPWFGTTSGDVGGVTKTLKYSLTLAFGPLTIYASADMSGVLGFTLGSTNYHTPPLLMTGTSSPSGATGTLTE